MFTGQENSERFIKAYESIRKTLHNRLERAGNRVKRGDFKSLITLSKKADDKLITQKFEFLSSCADIRNIMQHNSNKNGVPFTIPRSDVVEQLEALARKITNPGKASDYMVKNPAIISYNDTLKDASHYIIGQNFSQIPVYDKTEYKGLLTTNAISRWLAESIEEDESIVQEKITVKDILPFSEAFEGAEFIAPYTDALQASGKLQSNNAPPALLVTTTGKQSGELQGILTRHDVWKIENNEIP